MENKHCNKCGKDKEITEFGKKQRWCKECHRLWFREYYSTHADIQMERVKKEKAILINRNKEAVIAYLLEHPCVDCGETDIRVLEFDHKDPEKKEHTISLMLRTSYAIETIMEEINKCDVRCANCHRKKTQDSYNNYKSIWLKRNK